MAKFSSTRLIRVGKASASDISRWKEGVSLERDSKKEIHALCLQVAADRLRLAIELRRSGNICIRSKSKLFRDAISRYYYSMYHALRAVAFIHHAGDDHEAHSVLPTKIPQDLANAGKWANLLKSAREHRNRADYDPYPRGRASWSAIALDIKQDVDALLPEVKAYLISKGCSL